jgi:hypothetical protein
MAATTKKLPDFVLPGPKATPGEIADACRDLKGRIKEASAESKKLETLRIALDDIVRETAAKLKGTGFAGKLGAVTVEREDKLTVDTENGGWDKIYAWIKKTGNFDCLQKRLGEKAIADRLAAGVKVPGITTFPVFKVVVKEVK